MSSVSSPVILNDPDYEPLIWPFPSATEQAFLQHYDRSFVWMDRGWALFSIFNCLYLGQSIHPVLWVMRNGSLGFCLLILALSVDMNLYLKYRRPVLWIFRIPMAICTMMLPPALGRQGVCSDSWVSFWFYDVLTRSRTGVPLLFSGAWPGGILLHLLVISINLSWLLNINRGECSVLCQIPTISTRFEQVLTAISGSISSVFASPLEFCIAVRAVLQIGTVAAATAGVYICELEMRRSFAQHRRLPLPPGRRGQFVALHAVSAAAIPLAVFCLAAALTTSLSLFTVRSAYFPADLSCPSQQ
eukprot:jgi/Botrbrau1/13415/Bobra.0082s0021.1